ncbi:MAG: hypothetical protein AAF805_03865 [Planctomycetota bacterium]
MTPPAARRRRIVAPLLGGVLGACVLAGCSEAPKAFEMDEVTRLPDREELIEVDLGSFIVPVPVVLEQAIDRFEPDNLMQIEFDLFAVVEPSHVKKLERILERNGGRLRDRVIRVCRNTSRDDLIEAEWATLKAHLLDATQSLLGGPEVRRLGMSRIVKDEL